MAKLVLTDIANISTNTSVAAINANSAALEAAIENTLSRDGSSPNTMGAPLDMNSNRIVNLPAPQSSTDAVRKAYVDSVAMTGLTLPNPLGNNLDLNFYKAINSATPTNPSDVTTKAYVDALVENSKTPIYATRAEAIADTIASSQTVIIVLGYYTSGDGAEAVYKKVGSQPAHNGKLQSADGTWWELSIPSMFDSRNFGVSPNNTASTNTTCLTNCISAVSSVIGGGEISLPSGTLNFNALPSITQNNIVLKGKGRFNGGTTWRANNTTGDDITFSGCQFSGVKDVYFVPAVRKTNGYSIAFTNNCYQCIAENINGTYVYNGILVSSSTECRIKSFNLTQILGINGVQFIGTSSAPSFKLVVEDLLFNNTYPLGYPAPNTGVRDWTATTTYFVGQTVFVNNRILQCVVSGTSGSTAPNTTPGTGTSDAFSTQIVDGSVRWLFVANQIRWLIQNSYSYTFRASNCGLINGLHGIYQQNDSGVSAGRPLFMFCEYVEVDHPYSNAVVLEEGLQARFSQLWLSSSLGGNGFVIGGNHLGTVSVTNSSITTSAFHGVLHSAGPLNVHFTNCDIADNSQASGNIYHGVAIGAGASRFIYQSCTIGDVQGNGSSPQASGVYINAGASDYYIVADNIVVGNNSAGIVDGGTGTNKRVANNY